MNFNHPVVVEYMNACREVAAHFKPNCAEPPAVTKRMENAVDGIRKYLDDKGLYMPLGHEYSYEDETTHKYLNVIIRGTKEKGRRYIRAVENPEYRFK